MEKKGTFIAHIGANKCFYRCHFFACWNVSHDLSYGWYCYSYTFFFSRFIYSKNKQCKLYNTRCGSFSNYYSRSCVLWLALSTWFCPRLDSLTFNKTKDKKSENSKASRFSSVPRAFYCSFFCCFCNDKKPFADVYAHRPLLCAYSFLDRGSFPSFHIDISSHATIFSFY